MQSRAIEPNMPGFIFKHSPDFTETIGGRVSREAFGAGIKLDDPGTGGQP